MAGERGHGPTLDVVVADITTLDVDAVVNAANPSLLGGGGVDGAIHRAAGPQLLEACRPFGGCPTGEARVTAGFCLPARYVIHTPGPVWRGGDHDEDALLAACYASSLALARAHGIVSIAFPAISTGIYGFPADRAAGIAVGEVVRATNEGAGALSEVIFCCFNAESAAHHRAALERAERSME